jgi:hypothetical protein
MPDHVRDAGQLRRETRRNTVGHQVTRLKHVEAFSVEHRKKNAEQALKVVWTARYVPRSFAANIVELQRVALGETPKVLLAALNAVLTLCSPRVRNDRHLVALFE